MPNQTIKSYLVGLGWSVDQTGMRKFQDTLRWMQREVERHTTDPIFGIAPMFFKVGASVAGAFASMTLATAGFMSRVAQNDLNMQIFARRMFMSTDAARGMKTALDALGVSLEDVIWGPPELRERYGQLMKDQGAMREMLGPSFEAQMRRIRDLNFQFTRMGVGVKYLGMAIVEDIAKKLWGDNPESVNKRLDLLYEKFQTNIPRIADAISTVLAPALKFAGQLASDFVKWLTDPVNVTAWKLAIEDITGRVKQLWEWIKAPDKLDLLFGQGTTNKLLGGDSGTTNPFWREQGHVGTTPRAQYEIWAEEAAKNHGIDPALFKALIRRESDWNPTAVNKSSGAYGLGQLMPFNMQAYGLSGKDPQQNMEIAARLLAQFMADNRGNMEQALKVYGGFVSKDKIDREFPGYYNDIQKYADEYRRGSGARVQPQSMQHNEVHVYLQGTHLSADDVGNEVVKKISEMQRIQNQRTGLQFSNGYA